MGRVWGDEMKFEENLGKKVKNKHTGEIRTVLSYGDGPHATLADAEGNREDWIGFMVGSPVSLEWEEYKEEDNLEKIPVKDRTHSQHNQLIKKYGGIREYLLSMGEFKDVPMEDDWNLDK